MSHRRAETAAAVFLLVYLFAVGVGAAALITLNFPLARGDKLAFAHGAFAPFGKLDSLDQGLILLALLAGVAGSFLHAAQSLISYLGNGSFKTSWTAWYVREGESPLSSSSPLRFD